MKMMKTTAAIRARAWATAFLAAAMALGIAGCDRDEGPVEEAAEAVDEQAEEAGEAIEDAGEAAEDAAEDVEDEVEN